MFSVLPRMVLSLVARAVHPHRERTAIAAAQRRIRDRLVRRLARLPVGRRFHLDAAAASPDPDTAFRLDVPCTEYADYADLVAQVAQGVPDLLFPGRAIALAQTSGTTRGAEAGERYVPQNAPLLRHHRRGGAAALARLVQGSSEPLLGGRALMLSGCTALDRATNIPSGDLSGICAARVPRWLRRLQEPHPAIAAIPRWEERLPALVAACGGADIRILAGIPSWQLVLLDAIASQRGTTSAAAAWPDLRGVIHGGHAIEPFIPALRRHLHPETLLQEVYPASEAFIAIGERPWRLDEGGPPALELLTSHGIYLEFRPLDGAPGDCIGAADLEEGGLYRVLVTTPAGLVRYQIGDLVRGCGPGRVRFAGRVRTRLSVFGEHVEGDELAKALAMACSRTGAEVAHYHVAPVLPTAADPRGGHEWLVAFTGARPDLQDFAEAIDRHLTDRVLDYAAHRRGDGQLLAPRVTAIPAAAFTAALADRGRCDLQRKVPQAWNDRTIADSLLRHASGAQP